MVYADMGPHENFEVFVDISYYDMWCVRPKGSKDFNSTIHFISKQQAVHATHTIAEWMDHPNNKED